MIASIKQFPARVDRKTRRPKPKRAVSAKTLAKRKALLEERRQQLFDREIDSPQSRGLIPEAILERVEEMERTLEPSTRPAVEVGRLEVAPIDIR